MTSTEPDIETMPETMPMPEPDAPDPLEPAARARPEAAGTPVVLADGNTWLLADFIPDLGAAVWSSLFDDNMMEGGYSWSEVALASAYLLMANYRLDLAEAHELICGAELAPLVPAVERALFGVEPAETFGEWALTSLWVNSIDPDRLPPRLLWSVLNGLVRNGRAEPPAAAIRSARAAREEARWRVIARPQGIVRTQAEPAPPPDPAGPPPPPPAR